MDRMDSPMTAAPSRQPADARRIAIALGIAAIVVLIDQVTKALVRDALPEGTAWPSLDAWLAISHLENSGAAFGMLQGAQAFLLVVTVLGVAGVFIYLWRFPPSQPLYFTALSLILGGAIGNLIDRAAKGTVTDFIDPAYYPAFNIADSTIVCGVATILVLSFLEERRQ
ncbi:MAG: signal peptidase II [Chloroflexi bacterium]|nr:MAG: signal peptidase II [Chloroflexota bacterium]